MTDFKEIGRILCEMQEQSAGSPSSLSEMETCAKQLMGRVGREILGQWLQHCEEHDPDPTTKCRRCGKDATYVSKRTGFARTRLGMVRYRRAYYVCPHCFQSTYPLDERLSPYESLARLRTQIAAGRSLHVDELARAWGLGSVKGITSNPPTEEQNPPIYTSKQGSRSEETAPVHSHKLFVPLVRDRVG
jgi:hypothetical protein